MRPGFVMRVAVSCAGLLAVTLAAPSCGDADDVRGRRQRAPGLLLVSFDTLRADHLGCYGYDAWGESLTPHVDSLAARGVRFESAWATRGQTRPSLASMLSGKFPITTGLRENRLTLLPEHKTFFELMQAADWQTGVFLANFDTEYLGGAWAFRGADTAFAGKLRSDTGPGSLLEKIWDDRTEAAALDWLDQVDADRPWAAWVHFFDIHDPYNPPEGWDRFGHAEGLPEVLRAPGPQDGEALTAHLSDITLGRHEPSEAELARLRGLYDGAVAATDARLGRLLARLDELGLRDDTTILFTSDHGEELFDRNRYFFHDSSIYPGVLRIPLIMCGPGLPAGVTRAAPVQILDVAATVLDIAGLPVPADMESVSLLPLARGETADPPRPHVFIEWQDVLYSVQDASHKYVHNPRHAQLQKAPFWMTDKAYDIACFEGYDLIADPGQHDDRLAGLDPATLGRADGLPRDYAALRSALFRFLSDPRHERSMSWPGLGPESYEAMLALGYVGGDKQREDVRFGEDCAPPR